MRLGSVLCGGALFISACGGGGGGSAPATAFAGTLRVTSELPAGTTACVNTAVVTYHADGVDRQLVEVAGGDCLEFVNADNAPHQPAPSGATPCPELALPSLAPGARRATDPLAGGPKTCLWEDAKRPVPPGSGGGH